MKKLFFVFFAAFALSANLPNVDFGSDPKIAVQNAILAKVDGKTISVIDVKKKMDIAFHQHYSHLENSIPARFQFYEASWRHVLMEMIDHQLILADAAEKQIPLTDGEVREEMENRFGPNIMFTLDKIGLTYDETFKMLKDELIVQRMTWWFIHARAMTLVTPQDIRQAFRLHIKEHPPYQEWKYRVVAVRGDTPEESAKKIYSLLKESNAGPEEVLERMKEIEPSVQLSSEFGASDEQLSEAHRMALSLLSHGEYGTPVLQKSKSDGSTVARIFYLKEKIDHPAPQFETLSHSLRNELVQKAVAQESGTYLDKLRKNHPFYENVPENFHPFSLQ